MMYNKYKDEKWLGMTWRMANDQCIAITDMTDLHIENVLAMIGDNQKASELIERLEYEQNMRQSHNAHSVERRHKILGYYAGSFDPFHNGHMDIAVQALEAVDDLVIVIARNDGKGKRLTESRNVKRAIEESFKDEYPELASRVRVIDSSIGVISALTVETVKTNSEQRKGRPVLIRGLRSEADFQSEQALALFNREYGGVNTLFFMGNPAYVHYSSSLIRSIVKTVDVSKYLPKEVNDCVNQSIQPYQICFDDKVDLNVPEKK